VRALFSGPSGTGKTLAARQLAHQLGKDIFRIDLAATVNKYIGETEKALERALSAAEALDVVLLLDEGDALMARRTDVSNANDRYANLETNFLLQRIENFEGIILITSNDADRIDSAFSRRMDTILAFHAPDELRRLDILAQLLGEHCASPALLQDIACRCALNGGQLRNIALHSRLLALESGQPPGDEQLRAAVVREYRKIDSHCPLKPALAAVG
jgi:SpoVK/Ycf46/Vps4 family AAA+-type ATPase